MLWINQIYEEDYILKYLKERDLIKQYKKAKNNILSGNYTGNKLWYKQPKQDGILYFRINKQYRALCRIIENKSMIVFDIDNHQK